MVHLFFSGRIFIIMVLSLAPLFGYTQTFSGHITDINGLPVKGAIVSVTRPDGVIENQYSDDLGKIEMLNLPFGELKLDINKEGFQPLRMTTWFTIQTRHELEITLDKIWDLTMDSVTVTASTQLADFDGVIRMNRSQYKTMAGSFQDPSRVVLHYPGFSTDNDGTNAFFFRGLPGYTNSWQLSDAEIVNPNHLITAGNRGDALSVNSGGVNVLSSSVIGTYSYTPAASSIRQNNSIGGISHIELADKMKNFVDLSLIGAEAGYGFQHKNKHTYATARYSFVGLLEKMGVSFGNESINYQDFSVVSDLIKTKKAGLKGYVMYGQSSNIHEALPVEEVKTTFKDFQEIKYKSILGVAGLTGNYTLSQARFLHFTLNHSFRRDENKTAVSFLYPEYQGFSSQQEQENTLTSMHVRYQNVIGIHQVNGGVRASLTNITSTLNTSNRSLTNFRLYPYGEYTANWKNWRWMAGLALQSAAIEQNNMTHTINYSASLERKFLNHVFVRLSHRFVDQHMANKTVSYDNIHLKTFTTEISTGKTTGQFSWKINGFYNDVRDNKALILGNGDHISTYNGLDYGLDETGLTGIVVLNRARSLGMEAWSAASIQIGRNLWEMTGNIGYIKSDYQGKESSWLPAKTDIGLSGSFSTYVTIQRPKYEWNLGALLHARQGTREYEYYDDDKNKFWITESGMNFQQAPYSRLDMRIVYTKKGGKNRQHRISLDIQNVLNTKNPGFLYYDIFLDRMTRTTQLGLVPVLGYRFEY